MFLYEKHPPRFVREFVLLHKKEQNDISYSLISDPRPARMHEGADFVSALGCVEVLCGHFHKIERENRAYTHIQNSYFSLFAGLRTPDIEMIITQLITLSAFVVIVISSTLIF